MPGHAGAPETSCLLALRPDLVRRDRMPAREEILQPLATGNIGGVGILRAGVWEASDGRTDDSFRANGEVGERGLALIAGRVVLHRRVPPPGTRLLIRTAAEKKAAVTLSWGGLDGTGVCRRASWTARGRG